MKKWKCTVCGYIHTGEQPPLKCPVCGADQSKFIPLTEEQLPEAKSTSPAQTPVSASSAFSSDGQPKKWKCSVCGYIHTGVEPPLKCPVCGADQKKFVLMETPPEPHPETSDVEPDRSTATPESQKKFYEKLTAGGLSLFQISDRARLLTRLHGHPIAVHIPNGVLPLTVLFTLLAVLFKSEHFAIAAKYNAIFVCLAMPGVLLTGAIDWSNRFEARITQVFTIKMICGAVVTILTLLIVVWWIINPALYLESGATTGFFVFLNIVDLAAAAVAGFYGGKLVFNA